MTVKELLEIMDIGDHSSAARFPDGSGGRDMFQLLFYFRGHGDPLKGAVEEIHVAGGKMFVTVSGEKQRIADRTGNPNK